MSSSASSFRSAVKSGDPQKIAKAFELPPLSSPPPPSKTKSKKAPTFQESFSVDQTDWSSVLNAYLATLDAARAGDFERCYISQSSLHAAVNHVFASSKGNVLVPALHVVCRNTQALALWTPTKSTNNNNNNTTQSSESKMQNAVTLLQESFSRCLNDRKEYNANAPLSVEGSKKAGVLNIVIQLFRMYFKLNTLRLCKNLLRPVESRNLHKSGLPGDRVTYRYFVGRLCMFEDQYESAEENLEYALRHCHRNAVHNKQCILRYLVPVKLLRGRLPTQELLQKYDLKEYLPIVSSIRTGDFRTFNDGLQKYQDLFIRRGIYLLLEKCKSVCYRNLFKRIQKVVERHQLALTEIARAFKWLDMPMDLDELECILANLIFRGYIRGYISHTKRILVLSKSNPFPIEAIIVKKRT